MLTKNIYLLYPAGYSGNYVNWAISVSDLGLRHTTVKNPINDVDQTKYGGSGTSHLHHRIPTHQPIRQHLPWMVYNRPDNKGIYIVNTATYNMADTISQILDSDTDPVFIVIHDKNDLDIRAYGQINCITKWPVFLSAQYAAAGHELPCDPFNCDDQEFRNLVAQNLVSIDSNIPVDGQQLDNVIVNYKKYQNWYQARHSVNPHEVNEKYYIVRENFPLDSLFQFSCQDVVSDKFPETLRQIFVKSQCSTDYNIDYFKQFHPNYIAAQKNLQWFESIKNWRNTGALDDFLKGHSVIQGLVIREILNNCEFIYPTELEIMQWKAFYSDIRDASWPNCRLESDYIFLPEQIRIELQTVFGYCPKQSVDPEKIKCRKLLANWKELTLDEINVIYQNYKNKFNALSKVS